MPGPAPRPATRRRELADTAAAPADPPPPPPTRPDAIQAQHAVLFPAGGAVRCVSAAAELPAAFGGGGGLTTFAVLDGQRVAGA